MYVSLSRLRVPAERADELVTAFRARAGLVDEFDRHPGELTMVSELDRGVEVGVDVRARRVARVVPAQYLLQWAVLDGSEADGEQRGDVGERLRAAAQGVRTR